MPAEINSSEKPRQGSAWLALKMSWALLTGKEKRRGVLIAIANVLASLLDTISLVGVMPLVSLIVEPDVLTTNRAIAFLHEFLGSPDYALFVKISALGALALLAASALVNVILMVVIKRFRVSCQDRLAAQLTTRCVNAPYDWHLRQSSSTMAHHVFFDVLAWSSGGILGMFAVISHVSLLLLVTFVVLTAAALTGVMGMILVAALAAAVMLMLRPRIRFLSEYRRTASARAFSFASEFLRGIKDVKLSGNEPFFVRIYGKAFNAYGNAMGSLRVLQAIPPVAMMFLGQAGIVVIVLLIWASGSSSGEIASQMALVLLVTARVIPVTNRLVGTVSSLWHAIPNLEGIRALLDVLPQADEPARNKPSDEGLANWQRIDVEGIGYRYSPEDPVVMKDVTATLEHGKSYGVVGPTGAGKTTFIDLLLGLLHPYKGQIRIDGTALSANNVREWQNYIGYVPQNPMILDDTLLANVAFGVHAKHVEEKKAVRCLKMANLGDVLKRVSLQGQLGEQGDRLSGGQRQRVAIARALYSEPALLVLDEATSALDAVSERAVQKALENLRGKVTTVTVAHRLSTIETCDEIFVFEKARIVARGSYTELLGSSPLFARLAAAGVDETTGDVQQEKEQGVSA